MSEACPFCDVSSDRWVWRNHLAFAVRDTFPVSTGHSLVIPLRHISDWFHATREEQSALLDGLESVKSELETSLHPDGYNVGFNIGEAAGQTIGHLHVHLIPRFSGDMADPRGGVRHVLPWKGRYGEDPVEQAAPHARPLVAGSTDVMVPDPLLHHLRPCIQQASEIDILVAFMLDSGMARLESDLRYAVQRGARLRVITGDYLEITDVRALRRLLDLHPNVEGWVFESQNQSFHPKAWMFRFPTGEGLAFVGSSNMSQSALTDGLEWNLRVTTTANPTAYHDIMSKYNELLKHPSVRRLTADWVDRYEKQVALNREWGSLPMVPGEIDTHDPQKPVPSSVQNEALEALQRARTGGLSRGLVVLATGLGKTYLAAFDSNRPEFRRILFVAHRDEILSQAMRTFQRVRPDARCGKYTGSEKDKAADILFASVQTLGGRGHLAQFSPYEFDYCIVDEFHHATARTSRSVIDYFKPRFLLGLTATPERVDGADLLRLCDGNLVYHCDVVEGIERGLLAPFSYHGVPDEVDYTNIPWRNGKFDPHVLEHRLATDARAQNALEQWKQHGGARTLGFCASKRHADFMAQFFSEQAVRAVAVHSGDTSAPRALSLDQLERGLLQVVFSVDLFNEGLDIPEIDTVLMLRPTESRVIWLQQFGRGLRLSPNKDRLRVIDYIGNHRSFILKAQALFNLPQGEAAVARLLKDYRKGDLLLPAGCNVTYELRALEILESILKKDGTLELVRYYEDFLEQQGRRPSAKETFLDGFNPLSAKRFHGSWFTFVQAQGGLTAEQLMVFGQVRDFLAELETTRMEKSYKMALLMGMLLAGQAPGKIELTQLARAVTTVLLEDPRLRGDFPSDMVDGSDVAIKKLTAHLRRNPVHYLTTGPSRDHFRLLGDTFQVRVDVTDAGRPHFVELVTEVLEWRVEEYLQREVRRAGGEIRCKVSHNSSGPIIFLHRERQPGELPQGPTPLGVDGTVYEAEFVKEALNVVRRPGDKSNVLPALLRGWFGPTAGATGTLHFVKFWTDDEGHWQMDIATK